MFCILEILFWNYLFIMVRPHLDVESTVSDGSDLYEAIGGTNPWGSSQHRSQSPYISGWCFWGSGACGLLCRLRRAG